MATKINPDASCLREIYANGNPKFLAGNMEENPYIFHLDSTWQITCLDTANREDRYNVKISKTVRNIGEFSENIQCNESLRPLATPVETLEKRFRWFYTYYTFKAVYPCISDNIPVSIDKYMSKDEQKAWFQENFSAFYGMNGYELNETLNILEDKFLTWYLRNVYEIYIETVYSLAAFSDSNLYVSQLPAIKDTLFEMITPKNELDMDNEDVNQELDRYFNTTYFSDFYEDNKQQINEKCEERFSKVYFNEAIKYELIIPGKLISANTSLISQDTLTWKITAIRLLPDNYELTAISRTIHPWAFVVVFLLIAVSVYCLVKAKKWR
jgi:hypothetical protein